MVNDLLFSLIVPAYNIDKYINKCIDSLYDQDLDINKYEVIIINDGSEDDTEKVIIDYKNKYTNLLFISQNNSGVSVARDKGLSCASGKYVLFLDGDDWIETNSLSRIAKSLEAISCSPDVLILRSFTTSGKELYPWIKLNIKVDSYYEGEKLYRINYKRGSVCGCAFRREFILENDIFFPENISIGEDSIYYSLIRLYAKSAAFFDIRFYNVFERPGSASRSMSVDKIYNYSKNLRFLDLFLSSRGLDPRQRDIIFESEYGVISNAVYYFLLIGHINFFDLYSKLDLKSILPIHLTSGYVKMNNKLRLLNFSFLSYCLFKMIYLKLKRF